MHSQSSFDCEMQTLPQVKLLLRDAGWDMSTKLNISQVRAVALRLLASDDVILLSIEDLEIQFSRSSTSCFGPNLQTLMTVTEGVYA